MEYTGIYKTKNEKQKTEKIACIKIPFVFIGIYFWNWLNSKPFYRIDPVWNVILMRIRKYNCKIDIRKSYLHLNRNYMDIVQLEAQFHVSIRESQLLIHIKCHAVYLPPIPHTHWQKYTTNVFFNISVHNLAICIYALRMETSSEEASGPVRGASGKWMRCNMCSISMEMNETLIDLVLLLFSLQNMQNSH